MALVPKIDPNKIFASNAPTQDKPAAFDNYEKGMDETRKNNGRPTIKQLNYLHQTADQKILWVHQNGGGLPYDASIEYAEKSVTLKDGELKQLIGGAWVEVKPKSLPATAITTASTQNQQQINDFGGAKWYAKVDGYGLGATVKLDNGDTVQSTTAANIANPNADMTGWKKPTVDAYTKSETASLLLPKADKTYVDATFSAYVGGRKAYTTLALAQAEQATLVANTAIEVTNDGANNGTYQWDGTTLTKSAFDPLTQAITYTNKVTRTAENVEYSRIYNENGKLKIVYSNDFFYQKIKVKAGEKFFVRSIEYTIGTDLSKVWYLVDDDLNVLSEADRTPELADKIINVSVDSTLYVSGLNAYSQVFRFEKITDYDIQAMYLSGDYPVQKGIAYISDNAAQAKAGQSISPPTKSIIVENIKNGDVLKVDAKKIGIVNTYFFVTDDFTIISKSDGTEPNLIVLTVPQYATKLIACSDAAYASFSVTKADYFEALLYKDNSKGLTDYYPPRPNHNGLLKQKCPNFFDKFHRKNGDLVVVLSGSSLSQGNLYTTHRADASSRPPLLHANDLASYIFDALEDYWHGQKYMRYDHADVRYYDDTAWTISNDIKVGGVSIWDDRAEFKNGLTKTSTSANARVSAVIPVGAWQFNFIYRSDSQGANCVIDIYEGNGKIEVFNGSNWVEANNYNFSMLEPVKTSTKGNTCYQKRLKMRCKNKAVGGIDSLGSAKNITISKGADSDRFNVVGFEWSPREFMFTLINGARGSHNWGSGTTHNLENYQDTDIWEYKPDLILCEATTINWGGGWGYNFDPNLYVNYAKRSFFDEFTDNPLALKNKSENFGKCEVIFYGDTVSTHGGATQSWNADKTPKFGVVTAVADNGDGSTENLGRSKTIFENYEAVELYMSSKPHIFIPVVYQFKQLADGFYGNYPDAFEGTWYSGGSLSFDSIHLNDNGAEFWAYLITPLFDNL